jgi:hypothetical protein
MSIPTDRLSALVRRKMEALHQFNDVKDAAHRVLHALAERNRTSIRELYERYEVRME